MALQNRNYTFLLKSAPQLNLFTLSAIDNARSHIYPPRTNIKYRITKTKPAQRGIFLVIIKREMTITVPRHIGKKTHKFECLRLRDLPVL